MKTTKDNIEQILFDQPWDIQLDKQLDHHLCKLVNTQIKEEILYQVLRHIGDQVRDKTHVGELRSIFQTS